MSAAVLPGAPWEPHIGLDYAVVMLPGENTETASIHVYGEDDHVEVITAAVAAIPDLLAALKLARPYVERRADHEQNPDATTADRAALQHVDAAISRADGRT